MALLLPLSEFGVALWGDWVHSPNRLYNGINTLPYTVTLSTNLYLL